MMKNAFYFIFKVLIALKFFFFYCFGHGRKRLDNKVKVSFGIYGIIKWGANNCNTRISRYLKK